MSKEKNPKFRLNRKIFAGARKNSTVFFLKGINWPRGRMENAANHSPGPGMAQRSSSLPGPRPTDPENLPVNSRTRLIRKAVQPAGIAELTAALTLCIVYLAREPELSVWTL